MDSQPAVLDFYRPASMRNVATVAASLIYSEVRCVLERPIEESTEELYVKCV